MRFKRSVNLTADCFSSVFKLLLYRIVTGVIFFSLTYVILHLGLSEITGSAQFHALTSLVGEFFRALTTGDVDVLSAFQETAHAALLDMGELLGEHIASIAWSIVGVCAMYLLSRFFNGVAQFAVLDTMNDRLGSYARTRFSSAFFRNVGKGALYQVVYVPLAFVYDVLSLSACWFFFFFIPSLLPSWGALTVVFSLSLTLTALVCFQALKLTFISAWMPAMIVAGKSMAAGLKETAHCGRSFGRRFAGYLVAAYCIVVVNVCFGLFTVGSGLLITVPLSFVFLLAMQLINYYETTGRKYFVGYNRIAGEKEEPDSLE